MCMQRHEDCSMGKCICGKEGCSMGMGGCRASGSPRRSNITWMQMEGAKFS